METHIAVAVGRGPVIALGRPGDPFAIGGGEDGQDGLDLLGAGLEYVQVPELQGLVVAAR
jgi:hypothetical protein